MNFQKFFRGWSLRCLLILALPCPAPAAGFDFAILGDRTGNAVAGVYEQIVKDIANHHPAFVINVGDTIEGLNDATAGAQWDAIRPTWKYFGDIPFYLVPGNHDIWSPESEKVWRAQIHRAPSYSFDFRGIHVTVLDNSRTDALSPDQLAFLESDLAAHREKQPKFIFFHRPFWLLPVKFQNGDFSLHQLARKYGVSFIVSGHAHQFDRSELQGVQYVMVGSSGGSLTHGRAAAAVSVSDGLYFGYAWVHVEGPAATLEFRPVDVARQATQSGLGK
jgi:3',5'-cyclic AMP phosphodiesterase CpdA